MSKVLKIVGSVAAVVAGVVTGNPALILGGVAGLASSISGKPPTPSAQADRLSATINPREPFKRVFGRTAMATDVRYEEWFGTDQERCRWIVAVASHKIKSVQEIWLNDEMAWSSAGGVTSKFNGYFFLRHVILEGGAANGVTFGSGRWNNARRLRGCAFVDLEFKVTGNSKKAESPFSSGIPTRMTIIGEGALVYDPRRDDTVAGGDGDMRADDQSTWAFDDAGDALSGNLALQILAELLGWKINGKLALGSGLPAKRINMQSFITGANLCDELVNRSAGGTEPRYRGAGVLSEGDSPTTRLNTMLAACNGRLRDTDGRLSLAIMHNDLASIVDDDGLAEDDIVGAFTWNSDPSVEQAPNVARGKYTDPSTSSLYQQPDYPDVGFTALDGIERPMPYDLVWVESASQAQRCAKQTLQRRQYARTFETTVDMRAWKYGVGDPLPLTFAPLGFVRMPFRVKELDVRTNPAPIVLEAESDDIYAWDADDRAPVVPADPIVYDQANNPIVRAIDDAGQRAAYTLIDPVYAPLTSDDNSIDVTAFSGTIDDGRVISFPADGFTGLSDGTTYGVFWSLTAADYHVAAYPAASDVVSADNVIIGWQTTSSSGVFPPPPSPPPPPPGFGGGGYTPREYGP